MTPALPGGCKLVLHLPDGDREVEVRGPRALIGRARECDVNVPSESVSRRHASLSRNERGEWRLTDAGSVNGTFVNGSRVRDTELADGDSLRFGLVEATFRGGGGRPSREIVLDESRPELASVIDMREFDPLAGAVDTGDAGAGGGPGGRALAPAAAEGRGVATMTGLLTQCAEALLQAEELEGMLEEVMELAHRLLPAERGAICLQQPDGGLVPTVTRDPESPDETVKISRTIVDQVVGQGRAVLVTSVAADDRYAGAQSLVAMQVTSAICAPFYHEGDISGLIYLTTTDPDDLFGEPDLRVLSTLALMTAVGVKQADLKDTVRRERETRSRLERYSSPGVVERIIESEGLVEGEMLAEEREVTVLFCDLHGFTSMSEALPAVEVAQLLNVVFERLTDLVFEFEGTLDKFMGDGLMAVFGAPLDQPDHAERAVRAALAMVGRVRELNRSSDHETILKMRFGIESGRVVAGDIGSPNRRDYTVIGDAVNVASRLESSVAQPGQIVIGPRAHELVGEKFECRALGHRELRGKRQAIEAWAVVEPADTGAGRAGGSG